MGVYIMIGLVLGLFLGVAIGSMFMYVLLDELDDEEVRRQKNENKN